MASRLRPGIFVEVKPGAPAPIQGVSASTLGIAGWTDEGPHHEATLVTSFGQAVSKFGDFTASSRVMTALYAFFKNGGQKAYVVRTTPSDAEESVAYVTNDDQSVSVGTGDGAETDFTADLAGGVEPGSLSIAYYIDAAPVVNESVGLGDGADTTFSDTLANIPVKSNSASLSWYVDGVAVVGEDLTVTAPDGAIAIWKTTGAGVGEGTINEVAGPMPVKVGMEIFWTSGAVVKSQVWTGSSFTGDGNPAGSSFDVGTGVMTIDTTGALADVGAVSLTADYTPLTNRTATDDNAGTFTGVGLTSGTINYTTGVVTLVFAVAPTDDSLSNGINCSYTPLTAQEITDDGAGALTGDVDPAGANTVDYVTGDLDFKTASAPTVGTGFSALTATWDSVLQKLTMNWPGVAGDNYRVRYEGNPNYVNQGLGTHSRYDVMFDKYDSDTEEWTEVERFEACVFSDSASTAYMPNVLNDEDSGSDIATVYTPLSDGSVPSSLLGTAVVGEVIETGDASETHFTGTLAEGSAVAYSVTITSGLLEVTDDGSGNLIGDVDAGGTNTIDYDTGAYDVTFSSAPAIGDITADYVEQPATTSYTSQFAGGDDGSAVASTDVTAAALEADRKGIYAFDVVPDNLLVIIPDFVGDETVDGALVDWADTKTDRFVILGTPQGMDVSEVVNYKQNTLGKLSTKAAMYWPWIRILDPVTNLSALFPPVGHVAGVYARTINRKNVGKAPAGREDGQLAFLTGLEITVSDTDMETTYPQGINALIKRTQVGTAVWGARTLDPTDEYRYIQARLTEQFLSKAIYNGTHWVVFENNGSALWAKVKFQLNAFMRQQFTNGLFAGVKPADAYFIVVDETNNPEESVDAGILNVSVGFAPNKPAEFVVFQIQQKTQ